MLGDLLDENIMKAYVLAFKKKDEKYEKMAAIYDACSVAGISSPREVVDYFCDNSPEEYQCLYDAIPDESIMNYSSTKGHIIQVDLSKLPEHISVLRFCCEI